MKRIALAALLSLATVHCAYAVGTEDETKSTVTYSSHSPDDYAQGKVELPADCIGATFHCSGAGADGGLQCSLECFSGP